MPYTDDSDRFCPVCHGRRVLVDVHRSDYAPHAFTTTPCFACYREPQAEPPQPTVDDLIDAATARHAAAAGLTVGEWQAQVFAQYWGQA